MKSKVLEFSLFGNAKDIDPNEKLITYQRVAAKRQNPFSYHPQYKSKITYQQDLAESLEKQQTKSAHDSKKNEKRLINRLSSSPSLLKSGSQDESISKEDQDNVLASHG